MKNSYLEKVENYIKNKSAKKQIISELEAHIEDKTDYYIDIGYEREEAEQKALEEMGDPEQAAISLNALHSVKWYKNIFNIITLAALTVIFIFSCIFGYVFSYGNELNDISHSVVKDIVSLAIFSVLALILILSYRHKNKFTALSVIVFCVAVLLLPLVWLAVYDSGLFDELIMRDIDLYFINYFKSLPAVFEPLYFPLVTLFTKGPVGLVDSVFTPTAFPYAIRTIYSALSYMTIFCFIVWSLLVIFKIRQTERCKPSKPFDKFHKVFRIITICIALTMSAIMIISTVFACFRIPEYIGKRRDMIDFISEYKKTDTNKDVLNRAKSYGIDLKHTASTNDIFNFRVYVYYSGNCAVNYFTDRINNEYEEDEIDGDDNYIDTDGNILSYYVDNFSVIQPLPRSEIEVSASAFDNLKLNKTTLEDFKQDGDYYNAQTVTAYSSGKIQFYYYVKGSNYPWVLEFENGVLKLNESMDYASDNQEEEPETAIPEPESTVFNPLQ